MICLCRNFVILSRLYAGGFKRLYEISAGRAGSVCDYVMQHSNMPHIYANKNKLMVGDSSSSARTVASISCIFNKFN